MGSGSSHERLLSMAEAGQCSFAICWCSIKMSPAGLVKAALACKITNQEGARALRLTVRQFKRLKARFRRGGLRGLVHGRRGQPSPRRLLAALRTQIVTLMTTTYTGFNDVHLTEKLQQLHALPVS